jgi:hypothetical protein
MQSQSSDVEQVAVYSASTMTAVGVSREDRRHDGTSRVNAPSHLSTVHALSMTKAMLTALCSTSVVATAAGGAGGPRRPPLSASYDRTADRVRVPPKPKPPFLYAMALAKNSCGGW